MVCLPFPLLKAGRDLLLIAVSAPYACDPSRSGADYGHVPHLGQNSNELFSQSISFFWSQYSFTLNENEM